MFFLITGAAASGKTTMARLLRDALPDFICHDFDEKQHSTVAERCSFLEEWITEALDAQREGKDFVITAHAPFGELLAAPSAIKLDRISACLLDCDDITRAARYRARPQMEEWPLNQDTLCWASWQRMHAADPQWEQRVIVNNKQPGFRWDRWTKWPSGDKRWRVTRIDTTAQTAAETLKVLVRWMADERNRINSLTPSAKWWM